MLVSGTVSSRTQDKRTLQGACSSGKRLPTGVEEIKVNLYRHILNEVEAQNFLLRLDKRRYAEMITNMVDNGSITYGKGISKIPGRGARLWAIPAQKKAATAAMALVVSDDSFSAKKKEACQRNEVHPKNVKFDENKSSGKVDMTGWVV